MISHNGREVGSQLFTFEKRFEASTNRFAKRMALSTLQDVIELSPVDTGAFRASHQVSVNAVRGGPLLETQQRGDFVFGMRVRNLTPPPVPPDVINERFAAAKAAMRGSVLNRSIFVTNSLPYARALEFGHSKQAKPLGIYGRAQVRLRKRLRDARLKVS